MPFLSKVCGLTRAEDVAQAAAQGAGLLGFLWHPVSPRHCPDLHLAAPQLDRAVLVQVSEDPEAVLATATAYGFQMVQPYFPHGIRPQAVARLRQAGLRVLLPWADEPGQPPIPADLYLWEPSAAQTGVLGGSGQDHPMAYPPPGPFLLAGGLDGDNLAQRLGAVPLALRPRLQGCDAASRLEAAPGRKDPRKVAAFIAAARAYASSRASSRKGPHV